jgi:hypothetical protein
MYTNRNINMNTITITNMNMNLKTQKKTQTCAPIPEVGKVTLKSNSDEALSKKFL